MLGTSLRIGAVVVLALSLGGCVSLLPQAKPATLYRFGEEPVRADHPAVNARGVTLAPVEFPREAMTDGILTVEGAETSYLASARWIAPAPVLFRQALDRAFDAKAPGVTLMGRGEVGKSYAILDLQVVRFEADYTDPKGAPSVHVMVQARLAANNGSPIAAQTFDASVQASENGARAIVAAYNGAIDQALTPLARWVDQNTPAIQPVRSTSTTASTTSTSTTTTRQP
jgi:cholesterol transport system auxiliary component